MMKQFLDHFAAILGTFTVAIIIVSVTHELGYFIVVGRHFQTLLTTSDYFSNSIVWLPYVGIMMFGWFEWDKLREKPTGQPINTKLDWKNWKVWLWSLIAIFGFVAVGLIATWPPNSFLMISIMGIIVVIWGGIWPAFFRPLEGISGEFKSLARGLVLWGPPILLAIFFFGITNAVDDLDSSDPYFVYFKSPETAEVKVFLRGFDRGLLVRDDDSDFVEFHLWENIARVERAAPKQTQTLLCYLFGVCPPEKQLPPAP